jgi:hypothetical protein
MDDKELKPYQQPEFKNALRTAIIVLVVAAVVVVVAIFLGK